MRFLSTTLTLLALLASPAIASSTNSNHDDPEPRQLRFGSSAGNQFSFGNILRATPNPTAPATPDATTTGPNTTPGPSTASPAPGTTPGPSTGGPSTTKSPATPGPSTTKGPSTASPAPGATPGPSANGPSTTESPATPGPSTTSPAPGTTPGPSTNGPSTTKSPATPGPSTNGPSTTKSPATPDPSTNGPSTTSPAPGNTPGPSTNGPSTTKSPATPGPSTLAPKTPTPSTLAPKTPSPTPKETTESSAPPTAEDTKTNNVNLLANATVTLDPRFRWSGVAANLVEGDNRYQDFMQYPSTALSHCVYNTDFSPYVQIDLGEPKLLYGVTLWHYWGDERQYCSQYLKVSVDGETWTTIFDDGPKYGPFEKPEGTHHRFEVQAVRFLRHGAGPSTLNNAVHFLKISVDGMQVPDETSTSTKNGDSSSSSTKLPLRLVASGNGERLVATQNGKTFEYDTEEEEWNQILKDTWFQQVALSSDDLVAGVNGVGQILVRQAQEEEEDDWKLLKGDPHTVQEIARAQDRLWAIDDDGKVAYYTYADDQWTTDWFSRDYSFTHIAINHKGSYLLGLLEDGTLLLRKTSTNTWVKQEDLPEEAPKFVRVAIGGSHEVWASAEDGQVYHAWIREEGELHNWNKVDNQLQQIAPTEHGAIWGVSMDGMGILYCPNRNPKRHAFRCQYIVGPLGAVI